MRSVQVPARRLSILALAFVFAVGISACSEPAQEPQPIVLVITATPADTPTPVVIVVTATPLPPTPTLVPGFAGRLRVAGEEYSESTATPVIATSTSTPTPDPTRTPFPTSTPEIIVAQVAVETPTAVPTEIPVPAPTQFVCGYAEMVLIGAGKAHKPCITPTATAKGIFYDTATPFPTRTPSPVTTPTPLATPPILLTIATSQPVPVTATSSPVSVATQYSAIIPVPTAVPTNAETRHASRHLAEKQHMLDLINTEREKAGVPLIELGTNIAAQLHADSALDGCFLSHWGMDGLKPYMRYSLAGGYQANGENGSGLDYCIKAGDGFALNRSPNEEIEQAMEGLMNSPGHRRNIMDEHHKKVNVGLAWDTYNFKVVQHFEGNYVEFAALPSIVNGILSFTGSTRNGLRFTGKRDLSVQIYYDSPPHELTRGQVSRTYCYDSGRIVAALRWPLTGNSYWPSDDFTTTHKPCPDPYDVSPNAPPPSSYYEAHLFSQEVYSKSQSRDEQTIRVPWITAPRWTANRDGFSVEADISDVLTDHGSGVYTIVIWGELGVESALISEYSIFHGVTPPSTYDPD